MARMQRYWPFLRSPWVLAAILLIGWMVVNRFQRDFRPVRDAEAYVAEIYHVETKQTVGRGHPEIASVLRQRSTRLLAPIPPLLLTQGLPVVHHDAFEGKPRTVSLTLNDVDRETAGLTIALSPTESQQALAVPLETWTTFGHEADRERGVVRMLIFRINRPGS